MADSDCVVIMGSNMAENHPVAFRWVMEAKLRGATLIHVDPRFTRTTAVSDLHVPIRAGSDIAFLGGLISYMIEHERYFKDYVVHYTNAATLISDDFKDTENLDGVFPGLRAYAGDPINGSIGEYATASWQYARAPVGQSGQPAPASSPPFDDLVRSLKPPPALTDPTLQDA